MTYYNRDHKKINLNDKKFLNVGGCAKVFYSGDILLKEYYSETPLRFRLTEEMFDILKNINNPHFIELLDIYSDFNFIELLGNKMNILPFVVDAYTAKYYPNNSINVLFEQKDYILDNFRELEILFGIFSENMILTKDVRRENTIIGKDGIIIIDPDLFYIMNSSKKIILSLNKKELLNLFRDILIDSVADDVSCKEFVTFINRELVNFEVTQNTNVTYEISKKLKYVKKPIELFK